MIYYKTDEEIELIRQSCLLVCKTLTHVAGMIKPGVTGKELDKEAETFIRDHDATPAFLNYRGFPATLCISVNETVVHGIPSEKPFDSGDIASIDCGVHLNGFCGDAAYTFPIGDVNEETMELLRTTKTSLYKAIDQARAGKRIGDIGYAVQQYIEREHRYKYGVVRELVGHGLGRDMHEAPEVPNYGKRGRGPKLKEGLVIAIEPMVTMGRRDVLTEQDGWGIIAKNRNPTAHYEHTVAVRKDGADILSNHEMIEKVIEQNSNLKTVEMHSYSA